MLILEHDAKAMLADHGVPAPLGMLVAQGQSYAAPPFPAPWVVKAQVPVGGRGKAGGIRIAPDAAALSRELGELLGSELKGHAVTSVRVEQAVGAAQEAYISLSVQPRDATVTLLMAASGGVDVEATDDAGLLRSEAPAEPQALAAAVRALASRIPAPIGPALTALGLALAELLLARDAIMVEVNPVFVHEDGTWLAGDAKLILDDNALDRQPAMAMLLRKPTPAYSDVRRKAEHGFDFVVLHQMGSVGLVTTGAGLSMMLIDEMTARGLQPFNFCDIRTGQFRGDPTRLIQTLRWIAAGPAIRVVLVNIFAGITDLREFAALLVEALRHVPELRVPIVARLVGNGAEGARSLLEAAGLAITLEPDLDRAVALAARIVEGDDA